MDLIATDEYDWNDELNGTYHYKRRMRRQARRMCCEHANKGERVGRRTDIALVVSQHARLRQAQRNLSDEDLDMVLDYGIWLRRTGAWHVFLAARYLPTDPATIRRFDRLAGAIVLLDVRNGVPEVITCYRDACGLRTIKKMSKHRRRQHHGY